MCFCLVCEKNCLPNICRLSVLMSVVFMTCQGLFLMRLSCLWPVIDLSTILENPCFQLFTADYPLISSICDQCLGRQIFLPLCLRSVSLYIRIKDPPQKLFRK